jgi:protein SCO1/2
MPVTTHAGKDTTLRALLDRPAALAFFYSRCDNPNRCTRIVGSFRRMAERIEKKGLGGKVRLVLVSFEPDHDTPSRLLVAAQVHQLNTDSEDVVLVRPDPRLHRDLHRELNVGVNYSGEAVTMHDIGLYLFDRQGRYVRSHHLLAWDEEQVVEDLGRLAAEAAPR